MTLIPFSISDKVKVFLKNALYKPYLLNGWMGLEPNCTYTCISLGDAKKKIYFGELNVIFKVSEV